ncbi:phytanoyl-CoA dioxygenase family protein [Candidatus Pelagibacter sp.]|nr:phytanoyl-CoA dioxygenase family protein [Candidatus Pelagibacter sp.]
MSNFKKNLDDNGFCILKNSFNQTSLDKFYNAVLNINYFQLRKIGENQKKIKKIYDSKKSIYKKVAEIFELFEKNDKDGLHQLQKLYGVNNDMRMIIETDKIQSTFKELLNIKKEVPILIDGPGIFINRPKTKRLLYKWHSESHYYPKRRNFLNIWFPIFTDRNEKNGTMFIKEKSHLIQDLPFNEYSGYNKKTESAKHHFKQYEIPENFVKNLKTYKANVKLGDMLIFHRKSVHTSSENHSKEYGFAAVFRVWDMSKDLTLSGDLRVAPYRDFGNGRPNLLVETD